MAERVRAWLRRASPAGLIELFATLNLAFLALDVWLAHASNAFANRWEWAPVFFSALAPLALVPGLFRNRWERSSSRAIGFAIGAGAIAVGIAGMVFHLESSFFARQTLKDLVYSAPFVAPLSYVGLGLLLVLNRLEPSDRPAWGQWVLFLAMGGFVGNFALSVLDHAQNGFFELSEWVPVIGAAYGASFLVVAAVSNADKRFLRLCLWILAVEACIGVVGAILHLRAALSAPADSLKARLIFGAPVFAPFLFADLALLAALGIWHRLTTAGTGPSIGARPAA